MSLLQSLMDVAKAHDLPFLLIGGHAVNIHGFSRMTKDLDILVQRDRLLAWKDVLSASGYTLFREGTNFLQFSLPAESTARLDLMLVNDSTFGKLISGARTVEYLGVAVRVVSVEHLIALKLHVLRQDLEHRRIKDFLDIVELARANRVDLRSAEMQEIFERYGTPDLARRIKLACE